MNANSEEMLRIVPTLVLLSGILIAGLCVPLIQGKVPPNGLYGIRTRLSFSSTENWYRLNRYGGKLFLRVGIFIAIIGLAGIFLPASFLVTYSIIAAISTLGAVISAVIVIFLAQ